MSRFIVKATKTISAAHHLNLPYASKCRNQHGHNYTITVTCSAAEVDSLGMVVDFTLVKNTFDIFDHQYLNDYLSPEQNPTAEFLAKLVATRLVSRVPEHWQTLPNYTPPQDFRIDSVEVSETEGNVACYIP